MQELEKAAKTKEDKEKQLQQLQKALAESEAAVDAREVCERSFCEPYQG
jgi:hypothetical protein